MGIASFYYLPELSSGSLCTPFLFALSVPFPFFFRFMCLRVLRARHRARARHRRGSADGGGYGGVARSAVTVFVAKRRMCLETRGMHEGALSFSWLSVPCASRHEGSMKGLCLGLLVWCRLYYARVNKGRFDMQNVSQSGTCFCEEMKNHRERGSLSTNFVELANEGHCEHRAPRGGGRRGSVWQR